MKKKVLGRGLEALLPESEPSRNAGSTEIEIDIDLIQPNPDQPRFKMREEGLEQLAASIRANGVLQPVLVRPAGDGYQLVAGERRTLAAQRAGLLKVPAVIREVPDDHLLELALIENIQREDLNPIEEAQAYQNLLEHLNATQEELAARLGKERSTVANSLRLLKLPPQVKQLVAESQLSPGHARALLASNCTPAEMTRIAAAIVKQGWSVRMTERWAKKETAQRGRAPKAQDPNVTAAADKLRILLGTKVDIVEAQGSKGAGQIRIYFYSSDDLIRLYGILTEKRR
jgi:ParB family chromosome partitioning protein